MLTDKNILVTGATGFVGSHLVGELIKHGNPVTCLVQPGDQIEKLLKYNPRIIYGDITRKESLDRAVLGAEYVFHLAGLLGGRDSQAFYRINYKGTKNLVEVCREHGVKMKRFLFASSTAAIGPTDKDEILDEAAPCHPVTDYGKSKLMAEEYLNSINGDFPATIFRLPLVYGPGSHGGLFILFKLINKGFFPDLGGGETNVCFVQDAVEGMIRAAEKTNTMGKTYILGEHHIYSIWNIIDIMARTLEKQPIRIITPYLVMYLVSLLLEMYGKLFGKIPLITRNDVSSYIKHRYWRFNTSKAVRDFSFKISYPLENGIKITANWYKTNGLI